MSHDVYLYSYPKSSVKASVRTSWNLNLPVSHVDDVYCEVDGDADEQVWWLKTSACSDALNLLTPKDEDGYYNGDREFSVTKEQLIAFRQNIIDLDFKGGHLSEWITQRMADLQKLIDTFDFETHYLTVHTDC